jgi:hypothetical protein
MEYLKEAESDMKQYLMEKPVKENDHYFRDNLQIPYVTGVMKDNANREKLGEFTVGFVDSHQKELSTVGPVHMFIFGDKEISFLYKMFGITREVLVKIINDMYLTTYNWTNIAETNLLLNSPHKALLIAIIVDAIQKNDAEVIRCCEYLFGFTEYPLIYSKFWAGFPIREDIMNYTIDHLGNRFKIKEKKIKTLLDLLKYDMNVSVTFWTGALKTGRDHAYVDLVNRIRAQIRGTFAYLKNEYTKNKEKNATQHSQETHDDEGKIVDQTGHISVISDIVDNTYARFVLNPIYLPYVRSSAKANQVDISLFNGFLNQIFTTKDDRLYRLIECVVTSYLNRNPELSTVKGGEFLTFGLKLYRSMATSTDKIYVEINEIMDYWIYELINIKQYSSNRGTQINYRRAVFSYIIWMINHLN